MGLKRFQLVFSINNKYKFDITKMKWFIPGIQLSHEAFVYIETRFNKLVTTDYLFETMTTIKSYSFIFCYMYSNIYSY
jgi:hypothetical protein